MVSFRWIILDLYKDLIYLYKPAPTSLDPYGITINRLT
jgi:hypothetical protein